MFRTVLTGASFHKAVADVVASHTAGQAVAVDPLTMGYLARLALGGPAANDWFVGYIGDSLPDPLPAPSSPPAAAAAMPVTVQIRNEGWQTLPAQGPRACRLQGSWQVMDARLCPMDAAVSTAVRQLRAETKYAYRRQCHGHERCFTKPANVTSAPVFTDWGLSEAVLPGGVAEVSGAVPVRVWDRLFQATQSGETPCSLTDQVLMYEISVQCAASTIQSMSFKACVAVAR